MLFQTNSALHSGSQEERKDPHQCVGKRAERKLDDMSRLYSIIEKKLKNGMTTVTNRELAFEMRCSISKVARLLKEISKTASGAAWAMRRNEGGFLLVRRTELTRKNGEYRCRRVMNPFSPLNDEDGALVVTDMIAEAGKHYVTEGHRLSRRLHADPMQVSRWESLAVKNGWLTFDGEVYQPTGTHDHGRAKEARSRLNPHRSFSAENMPVDFGTEGKLVAYLKECGGITTATVSSIAKHLNLAERTLSLAISNLAARDMIFSHGFAPGMKAGRGRVLALRHLSNTEVAEFTRNHVNAKNQHAGQP